MAGSSQPQASSIEKAHLQAVVALWGLAGKHTVLPMHGYSMAPLLHEGDQIIIEYSAKSVCIGDILVFRQDDHMVIHRVLSVARKGSAISCWITKGDNNIDIDPPVTPEQVIGRVVGACCSGCTRRIDTFGWRVTGYTTAVLGRLIMSFLGFFRLNRIAERHAHGMRYLFTLPIRVRKILSRH
jgi:signal peptidase I